MRKAVLLLLTCFALTQITAQTEGVQAFTNPIKRLTAFIDQISSSEEHLLHKERMGPYLVNADGQRLSEHPYLKFKITEKGKRIPSTSKVSLESTFYVWNQDTLKGTYTAVAKGDTFLIDPLDLPTLTANNNQNIGWFVFDLTIESDAGTETREFGLNYFPPRPETGLLFRLISTFIPIVLLGLAVIMFQLFSLKRNQTQSQTA